MRLGSLASVFPHSSLTDLEGGLLNELIVIFVLLRNGREGVIAVQRLHLLVHHLVLGSVNVALQEVAEVGVVVRLSVVPAKKTRDLILLLVLRVENGVVSGADS